ncbi:hypothetical protein AYO20_10107 [Fonsecaea nubica]|uniref:Uncharacterized protein n=1 Tax=Fonsecaea nubica TaxID=856822 RepID=A0A178C902_9EURO|nr:hypothetical protein AYO20_10107 [Fonsecaea nubica]OAL26439.1 hypothetical protein AYO20_10107 [Fonsecaea nubica]
MSPILPLLFLSTVVVATHFQPLHPIDLSQGYARSIRNSSQLRSGFLHFDGLFQRDDCDPADSTPCPDGCYVGANAVCCANGGAVPQGDVCCDDSAGGGCAIGLTCGFCDTKGVCCSDATCAVLVDTDGSSVTLGPDDCKATAGNTVASVATVGTGGTTAPTPTPTPTPSITETTPLLPSSTENPPAPPTTTTEAPIPTTSASVPTVITVIVTTSSTSTLPPTPETTISTEIVSPPPAATTATVTQVAGAARKGFESHGVFATAAVALAMVGMLVMLA